jgi:hypothetical protein
MMTDIDHSRTRAVAAAVIAVLMVMQLGAKAASPDEDISGPKPASLVRALTTPSLSKAGTTTVPAPPAAPTNPALVEREP